MMEITSKLKAFTLVELMITLSIIGIVAALTIPILINNYKKIEYVTNAKKAYEQFNEALQQITLDYGSVNDLAGTGLFASGATTSNFNNVLVKYFKTRKICTSSGQGCLSNKVNNYYDGGTDTTNLLDKVGFITQDGIAYSLYRLESGVNCNNNYSSGVTNNMTKVCALLTIDTNGPSKGPNYRGRDIIEFWVTSGQGALLYPRSGIDDNGGGGGGSWWMNPSTKVPRYCYPGYKAGHCCAGRILEEGWTMNY